MKTFYKIISLLLFVFAFSELSAQVTVYGAGSADVNGNYEYTGLNVGRPKYEMFNSGKTFSLYWNGVEWGITSLYYYYTNPNDTPFPPESGWIVSGGAAPAPFCSGDVSPLPVELTSFSGSLLNNVIKLEWNTATEVNNYGFEVLRSNIKDKWEKIAFVEGHGNSNSPKYYSFIDNNAPKSNLSYKLKQIDFDGAVNYSKIIEVNNFSHEKSVNLFPAFPNPFNPTTTIRFEIQQSSFVSLKIFDLIGNEVAVLANENKQAGEYKIEFDAVNLPSGIYFCQLNSGKISQTQKLLLMK